MSVWMNLLVAPQKTQLLTRDQFGELLYDLLQHEIVKMPCAVLSADYFNVGGSLSIANIFIGPSYINGEWVTFPLNFPPGSTMTIHYCGERVEELLKALSEAPYGTRDLCVWFAGLNFDNDEISSIGSFNADVVVYAIREPQEIFYDKSHMEMSKDEIENEMDENPDSEMELEKYTYIVQSCFRTIGSSGPYKTCAPMDVIFERYFGKDFIVDCSYV